MILLSEVFEVLQGAEFNSLSIVNEDGGEARIDVREYNRLINLVNAGISALHKRFELKKNTIRIKTTQGKFKYVLESKNTITNDPADGFILDTPEDPFMDDLIEITQLNAPNGRDLILNNYRENIKHGEVATVSIDELRQSIYTLNYRTLRVPVNLRDSEIMVTYKSSGKKIPQIVNGEGGVVIPPEEVVIELPIPYLNAITFYVAHRVYNSKGAETIGRGIFHEGNNYKAMYESEINSLSIAGLEEDVMIDDTSGFYNRGFV